MKDAVNSTSVSGCIRAVVITFLLIALGAHATMAQGRLILNGGTVNITNGATLVIANPNPNAITRNSGFIISEGATNTIRWNVGTTAGTFVVPWGNGTSNYFPLSFTLSGAAGSGYISLSTIPTASQNSLGLPAGISHFNGANGEDVSLVAVDRFWKIEPQGYSTRPAFSNLTFTYLDVEFATPNKVAVENKLTAMRWNGVPQSWTDFNTGGAVNTTANTVTVSSITDSNFNPWWSLAYPGGVYHWVAPSGANWNATSNWSLNSGGSGGAGIPGAGDVIYFDAVRSANCSLDIDLDVSSMQIASGFSGTITQGSRAISVTNDVTLAGGTFTGGSGPMLVGGNLTISGTTFASTSGTLDVRKDVTISSGSFVHNNGTVQFSGSTTQHLTSSAILTMNNISITNTSSPGLFIESNVNMEGTMTLAANVTVDPDGQSNNKIFTLRSTGDNPTRDAAVGILPAGAKVDGNVTVQRFMAIEGASGGRIYRYISSPVQLAAVSDIQNEIPVTGSFTGRSTCSGCTTSASMFAYDETITADNNGDGLINLNDGYVSFPKVSNAETLATGRGYAMFVRGNLISSARWDVKGTINAGNVTAVPMPVTYTSSGVAANDGWNLVGNPFPSSLDWNAASGWTKNNVNGAIYIRDNGASTGQFASWNGVVGTNGGSRYIAMGQAFWVQASGAAPALSTTEMSKAAGIQTTFFREEAPTRLLRIVLNHGAVNDEAVVHFRDDATNDFDAQADARKLPNATFNLSTQINGKDKMAINSLSSVTCDQRLQIVMDDVTAGDYSITFSNIETFPGITTFVMTDRYTGKSLDLRSTQQYAFSITSDTVSFSASRFALSVSTPVPVAAFTLDSQPVCAGTSGSVVVENAQDSYIYTAWAGNTQLPAPVTSGNVVTFAASAELLGVGTNQLLVRAMPVGCGAAVEKTIALQVLTRPSISAVTATTACREGVVSFIADGGNTSDTYRWYQSDSTTLVTETADSAFSTPELKRTTTYYVSIANRIGCESRRLAAVANVIQFDDPVIIAQNDSLKINYTSGIQWFENGVALSDGQTQVIHPLTSGQYSVTVQVGSCVATAEYSYTAPTDAITGIPTPAEAMFQVYPNPVREEFFLKSSLKPEEIRQVRVYDLLGHLVGYMSLSATDGVTAGSFNMKGMASGWYILSVNMITGTKEVRLIKQ